jgi:hypothetical protein
LNGIADAGFLVAFARDHLRQVIDSFAGEDEAAR